MKSESIIIHKGEKEEKYKIYVEDYVISYLKYETGTLELSEIFFFGYRERNAKEYVIYGAGRDRRLTVFNKYDLLEKIACRLTQGGPVFMVREKEGLYEVKGYDIFYCNNEEMQSYLVDRKQQCREKDKTDEQTYIPALKPAAEPEETSGRRLHNTLSLQLGVIFVILVAIVINSTNSYDKMEQLNRSAQEVFFAMENQETSGTVSVGETQEEIVVERDLSAEHTEDGALDTDVREAEEAAEESEAEKEEGILKSAIDENEEETAKRALQENETAVGQEESLQTDRPQEDGQSDADKPDSEGADGINLAEEKKDSAGDTDATQQNTEALSRNITRYYEIERGDTLYTISEKIYGDISKVEEICELNQITDPDQIHYGQKIILP